MCENFEKPKLSHLIANLGLTDNIPTTNDDFTHTPRARFANCPMAAQGTTTCVACGQLNEEHRCTNCDAVFVSLDRLIAHCAKERNSACDARDTHALHDLRQYNAVLQLSARPSRASALAELPIDEQFCFSCDAVFESGDAGRAHKQAHANKQKWCALCQAAFGRRDKHMRTNGHRRAESGLRQRRIAGHNEIADGDDDEADAAAADEGGFDLGDVDAAAAASAASTQKTPPYVLSSDDHSNSNSIHDGRQDKKTL